MPNQIWQTLSRDLEGQIATDLEPLTGLGVLTFSGPDVRPFLQGYLTCDVEALTGTPELTALCNLQGRVVAAGWCAATGPDSISWILHETLAQPVVDFMAPYQAFSRTGVEIRTDDYCLLGVTTNIGRVVPWLIDAESDLPALLATVQVLHAQDWHTARIRQRTVLLTSETSASHLPQMLGLTESGAVDFDKGCYLGQEVVARAQHRGQVKRRLEGLTGDGTATIGSLFDRHGKAAGEIVDVCGGFSLAVVRDSAEPPFKQDNLTLNPFD